MSINNKDENNQSLVNQKEVKISTSKKLSEPMDIVIGFQSGANRVCKYGGEVEYGRESIELNNNAVYNREYIKYRNQSNQLVNELKTEYKTQDGDTKVLENIVSSQKIETNQENFSQEAEKVVENPVNLETINNNNSSNDESSGSEN